MAQDEVFAIEKIKGGKVLRGKYCVQVSVQEQP
jgi:hypothetical protein